MSNNIKSLVSILTPCYNAGNCVGRLLETILEQDYENIETIVVDDGSTDNTAEVVNSFISRFEENGYPLIYLHQPNQGKSAAINNGLKRVSGEFLMWPDSGDYYKSPHAISAFVEAFKGLSDDYAVVRGVPTYVDRNGMARKSIVFMDLGSKQFENCLFGQYFVLHPGNYMMRMSAFDACVPHREIYTERYADQCRQMLLPVLYAYHCHALENSHFCVPEKGNEEGRHAAYRRQILRTDAYERTVGHVLPAIKGLPAQTVSGLLARVKKECLMTRIGYALHFSRVRDFRRFVREYKKLDRLPSAYSLFYVCSFFPGALRLLAKGK